MWVRDHAARVGAMQECFKDPVYRFFYDRALTTPNVQGGGANLQPPDAEHPAADQHGGGGEGGTAGQLRLARFRVRARSVRRNECDGDSAASVERTTSERGFGGALWWNARWELGSHEGTTTRSDRRRQKDARDRLRP